MTGVEHAHSPDEMIRQTRLTERLRDQQSPYLAAAEAELRAMRAENTVARQTVPWRALRQLVDDVERAFAITGRRADPRVDPLMSGLRQLADDQVADAERYVAAKRAYVVKATAWAERQAATGQQ